MKNNKCPDTWSIRVVRFRKESKQSDEKKERESVQHPIPPPPSSPNTEIRYPAPRRKGWRDRLWPARSRWMENLFRRVFRMRTVTEHDLRAENRGAGEKLLVVGVGRQICD